MTQNAASTSPAETETGTPPTITVNGDNPAIIHVRDTYNDLGAAISGPTADLNLGLLEARGRVRRTQPFSKM